MLKKIIIKFLIFFSVTSFAASKNQKISHWSGTYEYSISQGKTVGGSSIVLDYTLKINTKAKVEKKCKLEISGFQTWDEFICSYDIKKDAMTIMFKSYADGSLKNKYGNEVYQVGESFFVLTRGKNNKFRVKWKAMKEKPSDPKNLYFKYSKSSK